MNSKTDLKPSTINGNRNVEKLFFEQFSQTEFIEQITPDRLLEWKNSLSRKHAPSSIRGYLLLTKAVFDFAVKRNWLAHNPMEEVPIDTSSQCVNREKFRTITVEEYVKLLEACRTQEWRVIVALARWLGLRCPSELEHLRWNDIVLERQGVHIRSPKTERHVGHQGRFVPLFQEAAGELERLRHQDTPAGDDLVIPCIQGKCDSFLNRKFHRIIRRAGLGKIDQPFLNMRRTRSNEIRIQYGPEKESEWMGHSQKVMRVHYLDLSVDDFTNIVCK
jgi:integrase